MSSRVSHMTIDCLNAFDLSEWWKPVLGYTDVADDPNEVGDDHCMIVDPVSGQRLLFIEVDELRTAGGRIHLDLAPSDRRRDDEVDRVVGLDRIHGVACRGLILMRAPAPSRTCLIGPWRLYRLLICVLWGSWWRGVVSLCSVVR